MATHPRAALDRLVFFSDGVFAIAITLLALELRLPEVPGGYTDATLLTALTNLAPSLFAFTMSFVVIAGFWLGHFRTFRAVERLDGRLVAIDLLFLFFVALVPFPTSIVASDGNLPYAAILYAAFVALGGSVAALLWYYPAQIGRLVTPTISPQIARRVTLRTLVTPAVFAASIPVALASPTAAEVCWVLSFALHRIVSRRLAIGPLLDAALEDPSD